MRIGVFGAGCPTGRRVVEQAFERRHKVSAFVRSASELQIENEHMHMVEGDSYDGTNVDEAVIGVDAVINVLWQSEATPDDILSGAGRNIFESMAKHDVDRYVTLVGAGVRTEDESVSLGEKVMGTLSRLISRSILEDAEAHVADVRETDLKWTVVRVLRLGDGKPRREYRTGTDIHPGLRAVDRVDVADFMLDVVETDRYIHELPKIGY